MCKASCKLTVFFFFSNYLPTFISTLTLVHYMIHWDSWNANCRRFGNSEQSLVKYILIRYLYVFPTLVLKGISEYALVYLCGLFWPLQIRVIILSVYRCAYTQYSFCLLHDMWFNCSEIAKEVWVTKSTRQLWFFFY